MGMYVWSCVVVLLMYVFFRYPPPPMSPKLQQWREEGRYFIYNNQSIFYKDTHWNHPHSGDSGDSGDSGPVLLCLHGFPSLSYDWSKVWPRFQSKFGRVVALDFLGFGFSGKPEGHDYHIMEQADIVEHLLEKLQISKVHIIAHDYGDTVAQELLYRYEIGRVQGNYKLNFTSVCFTNGGIFPETNYPRLVQQLLLLPGIGPIISKVIFFQGFKTGFSEVFGEDTQPTVEDFNDFWAAIRFNDGNNVMYRILEYIHQRRHHRLRWVSALEMASIPVRLIYGPADPVNPQAFLDTFRKHAPTATVSLLPASVSHYPHWEAPDLFIQAYWGFLDTTLDFNKHR